MFVIKPKKRAYKAYALMTYSSLCELITYALRQLHTNPLDWIKKNEDFSSFFFGAGDGT